jgi:hypothetical protein
LIRRAPGYDARVASADYEERRRREARRQDRHEHHQDRGSGGASGGGGAGAVTGFLPWIIFWVVSSPSTWKVAAVGALIAAVIVSIPDAMRPGGPKSLDLGTIAFFALISILAIFLDRKDLSWLEDWSQVISSGALAAIAFISLAYRPFTEEYARDTTPPEVWDTHGFKLINRQLTTFWGVVFALTAISGVIAIKGSHSSRAFFTWILPIILVVGGFKLQRRYIEYARARGAARRS